VSTYTKLPLSGSTDGRGIKVAATAIGSGTTIHTATSSASLPDLITIFGYNSDTVPRTLTIGWGGTTSPDDLFAQVLPPQAGLILVTADKFLRNSLIVKAAGDAANVIVLFGYVNRIS
jgi:hypothetical protein